MVSSNVQVSELLAHKPPEDVPSGARAVPSGDAFWLAHYHALERHIRENKLKATFADELGRAQVGFAASLMRQSAALPTRSARPRPDASLSRFRAACP